MIASESQIYLDSLAIKGVNYLLLFLCLTKKQLVTAF